MCNTRRRPREWRCFVADMIEFSEKILSYTKGVNRVTFVADERIHNAMLRDLELICEAASNVPIDVREAHPEIKWLLIFGVRNRLVHGFLSMGDDIVWDIIQTHIPALLPALRNLLNVTNEDSA